MKPLLIRRTWEAVSRRFPRFACDVDFLRRNHNFEPDLWLVPKFCSPTARSIDVGANKGIYSRWMCRHSARVEAFECNPILLKPLRTFLTDKATRAALGHINFWFMKDAGNDGTSLSGS